MEETNSKIKKIKRAFFNFKTLNKILFAVIISLGVYYIAGTNDLTVKGFVLGDLKQQRDKLVAENNKLELTAMSLSSFSSVKEKIDNLKMVAVGNIQYINGNVESVALK